MSFIVQPAPLMMNAPKPKSTNILRSGRDDGAALSAMLHPHGQNSSQEPATYKPDDDKNTHKSHSQRMTWFWAQP
jgi:hypothetical protein